MKINEVIKELKSHSNPENIEGMARFGINPDKTLGISIPVLRKMAKKIGPDHALALQLWETGIHEAKILASMVDEVDKVNEKQMEDWVKDFDSWDVCDQTAMNLFWHLTVAKKKAVEWTKREEEFVKRAGFALMAVLAWKDKKAQDKIFESFLPVIEANSNDNRNFVKKAVNWALRQIGKRNLNLNKKAVQIAKKILKQDSKCAKWIANDAIKELTSEAVNKRLSASWDDGYMNQIPHVRSE